jgi:hypothetical protein
MINAAAAAVHAELAPANPLVTESSARTLDPAIPAVVRVAERIDANTATHQARFALALPSVADSVEGAGNPATATVLVVVSRVDAANIAVE